MFAYTSSNLIFLFIAGMIGAFCRFLVIEGITLLYDKTIKVLPYPHHTFVVNVVACFIMGIVVTCFGKHSHPIFKSLITVGFLGAFSTFSTYIGDVFLHLKSKKVMFGILYCIFTLVFSFGAGMLGRLVAGGFS